MWLPVPPKAIDSLLQLLEAAYSALTARLGVAPDNPTQPDPSVDLTGSSDEDAEPPAKQRRLGLTQVELAAKQEAVDAALADLWRACRIGCSCHRWWCWWCFLWRACLPRGSARCCGDKAAQVSELHRIG